MKLEYSRPANNSGNFGDDINEWFWNESLPGALDEDDSVILLGMGTILSRWFTDKLPLKSKKIVIGSGGGKKGGPPILDGLWHVYGVRGPLTASYSNLPSEMILTDPAMLITRMDIGQLNSSQRGVGFMPHIWSVDQWNWRETCKQLGLTYLDPRADSKETIRAIASLERVVTEAMHGAIVADAVRTPWVAVSIADAFEPSKWCDWAGSLGLAIRFYSLPYLSGPSVSGLQPWAKSQIKNVLAHTGYGRQAGYRPNSNRWTSQHARQKLHELAFKTEPQLSEDAQLNRALDRLDSALDRLKRDMASGVFK